MRYQMESWTIPLPDDEEPCKEELVETTSFAGVEDAKQWVWDRLEEGFFVRMFRI